MSVHPNSLDLEAFACGETVASVTSHLADCAACTAFVERLRGAMSAGPSRAKATDAVTRAASRSRNDETSTHAPIPTGPSASASARRRWLCRASTVAAPLAAAAALLAFLREPPKKDPPGPPLAATAEPTVTPDLREDPVTNFKGTVQVAVIRDRAGVQARFTNVVAVKPGDRLRVEVALDREQAILAAVLGDDASWLELMSEGVRRSGTHFSERSARVDASPMRGIILVGSPQAVSRARQTRRFEEVATVRVEWEVP